MLQQPAVLSEGLGGGGGQLVGKMSCRNFGYSNDSVLSWLACWPGFDLVFGGCSVGITYIRRFAISL